MPGAARLLVISDTLAGGLGAVVRLQADWFTARQWSVTVAAPSDGIPPERPASFAPLPRVVTARRPGEMTRAHAAMRALRHEIDDRTVVHVHGMRSLFLARLARLPTPFVTLHGAHPHASDPAGYALLRKLWLAAVPRLCVRAVTVEPGYDARWHYERHASPLLRHLDVLPMPNGALPTIGWLGALEDRKQPEIFVRAIAEVSRRGQPIRGLLGGSGPRASELSSLVHELSAPVEILGQTDAASVLRRSWALALFARSEGTPLAAVEAMWAGRTVVGSRLPGIQMLIGDTGTVASTVQEAADAFVQLAQSRDRATRLGLAAAERVRSLLGPWTPWDTTEAHYLRYLGSRAA